MTTAPLTTLIAAVHAAGGSIERRGGTIKLAAPAPLPAELLARLRQAKPALLAHLHDPMVEPMLLADGRRQHRFRAVIAIPSSPPRHLLPLVILARFHNTVLVADGCELVVIEPWLSNLPPSTLSALAAEAAGVIAHLRAESQARTGIDAAGEGGR